MSAHCFSFLGGLHQTGPNGESVTHKFLKDEDGTLRIRVVYANGKRSCACSVPDVVIPSPEKDPKMKDVHAALLIYAESIDVARKSQPDNAMLLPAQNA